MTGDPSPEAERALLAELHARGWDDFAVLNVAGDALMRRVWFGVPIGAPLAEQMGWVRVEHSTATAGVLVRFVASDTPDTAPGTLVTFDLTPEGLGVVRAAHVPGANTPAATHLAEKERRKEEARARVEARRRAHPLNEWWRR